MVHDVLILALMNLVGFLLVQFYPHQNKAQSAGILMVILPVFIPTFLAHVGVQGYKEKRQGFRYNW